MFNLLSVFRIRFSFVYSAYKLHDNNKACEIQKLRGLHPRFLELLYV